jgi:hypothetical protein
MNLRLRRRITKDMLTMLASLFGGLLGFIPELIKLWKDKGDKAHELKLLDVQAKNAQLFHEQRILELNTSADIQESVGLYKTYTTGITWVDALNGTVRPVLTYSFFMLYAVVKYFQYTTIGPGAPMFMYTSVLWTQEDQAIFAAVISFYFGNRALTRTMGRK